MSEFRFRDSLLADRMRSAAKWAALAALGFVTGALCTMITRAIPAFPIG